MDFRHLYESEVTHVWNCLRRLGVPDRDLADKVHDVFVTLHRRLPDVDPTRPIRPYVSGIALRVASDYRRAAPQRRQLLCGGVEVTDETATPESLAMQREARDLLLAALEPLDDDQREVFVLHELEEHTMPEIAEILGVPLNTCYSRLRLARQTLTDAIRRLQRGGM